MRTLIWSDIHNRIGELQEFLGVYYDDFDEIVFLGDWFDNFGDKPIDAQRTAKYLKSLLNDTKFVFLWGNHDICYAYSNPVTICSGFTHEKRNAISVIMSAEDWTNFKFFHRTQGWICSHAGLTGKLFKNLHDSDLDEELTSLFTSEFKSVKQGKRSIYIGNQGYDNKGVLWCRSNDFKPINGVNQIFGHTEIYTPHVQYIKKRKLKNRILSDFWENPPKREKVTSYNWCIDTKNRHYAFIENGLLEVRNAET